jgi:hypothetical protein
MFSQRHRLEALEVLAMLEAESITIAVDRSATAEGQGQFSIHDN